MLNVLNNKKINSFLKIIFFSFVFCSFNCSYAMEDDGYFSFGEDIFTKIKKPEVEMSEIELENIHNHVYNLWRFGGKYDLASKNKQTLNDIMYALLTKKFEVNDYGETGLIVNGRFGDDEKDGTKYFDLYKKAAEYFDQICKEEEKAKDLDPEWVKSDFYKGIDIVGDNFKIKKDIDLTKEDKGVEVLVKSILDTKQIFIKSGYFEGSYKDISEIKKYILDLKDQELSLFGQCSCISKDDREDFLNKVIEKVNKEMGWQDELKVLCFCPGDLFTELRILTKLIVDQKKTIKTVYLVDPIYGNIGFARDLQLKQFVSIISRINKKPIKLVLFTSLDGYLNIKDKEKANLAMVIDLAYYDIDSHFGKKDEKKEKEFVDKILDEGLVIGGLVATLSSPNIMVFLKKILLKEKISLQVIII